MGQINVGAGNGTGKNLNSVGFRRIEKLNNLIFRKFVKYGIFILWYCQTEIILTIMRCPEGEHTKPLNRNN